MWGPLGKVYNRDVPALSSDRCYQCQSVVRFCFSDHARSPAISHPTPPPSLSIPSWRGLQGVYPKPSQIGVDLAHMGTDWRWVEAFFNFGDYPILAIPAISHPSPSPIHPKLAWTSEGCIPSHPRLAWTWHTWVLIGVGLRRFSISAITRFWQFRRSPTHPPIFRLLLQTKPLIQFDPRVTLA